MLFILNKTTKKIFLQDNTQVERMFFQHIVCEWRMMNLGEGLRQEARRKGGKEGRKERTDGRSQVRDKTNRML